MLKGFLEFKLQRRVAALCFLSIIEEVHSQMIGYIFLSQLLTPSRVYLLIVISTPRRDGSVIDSAGNVRMDLVE